jgi:hypothetical protein
MVNKFNHRRQRNSKFELNPYPANVENMVIS